MLGPHWPIRPANGSPRIGRFAHLTTWRAQSGWERRSPIGVTLFSHWLALRAKTTSMRPISTHPSRQKPFQAKLAELEPEADNARPLSSGSMRKHATSLERKGSESIRISTIERIETSGPAHFESRRVRDREHLKFVAGHPCLICGSATGRSSPPPICTKPSTWTQGK